MIPLITLTSDFGTRDPYVGLMKGVIFGINPQAVVVDLCHDINPHNILQGAFLLGNAHRFFGKGSIHVAVVDPGVGTTRRSIVLATLDSFFIAPDNGLLSYVVKDGLSGSSSRRGIKCPPPGFQVYHLTDESYWLHPLSNTFHGRDIMAPVAAHLSLGVSIDKMGEETDSFKVLSLMEHMWDDNSLKGQIVHIDNFGNLISDIPASVLNEQTVEVMVKGQTIHGLSSSYESGGDLLAIIGSYNTLEISVNRDNAARLLKGKIGDIIRVKKKG